MIFDRIRPLVPVARLLAFALAGLVVTGGPCWAQGSEAGSSMTVEGDRPVVDVTATDTALHLRSAVSSGWVTFRMTNEGSAHHSFKLRRLPDGRTFADYRRGLLAPADSLETAVLAGRIDSTDYQRSMRQQVPAWYGRVTTVGGITGLAPGRTAQITHNLEPGHYVLACLFKTPAKRTHALAGVRAGLTVTSDTTGAAPPSADVTARLSPTMFEVDTTALSDEQTIAFRSEHGDEGANSPFVGLFRLTSETGKEEVVAWMEKGIPLPAPTDWIGGPEPMPPGDVAYVRVGDLPPGRYAWITEKAPTTDGMMKTFVVEDP